MYWTQYEHCPKILYIYQANKKTEKNLELINLLFSYKESDFRIKKTNLDFDIGVLNKIYNAVSLKLV